MWTIKLNLLVAAIACVSIFMYMYRSHTKLNNELTALHEQISSLTKTRQEADKIVCANETNVAEKDNSTESIPEQLCSHSAISDEQLDEVTSEEIDDIMTNLCFGIEEEDEEGVMGGVPDRDGVTGSECGSEVTKCGNMQINVDVEEFGSYLMIQDDVSPTSDHQHLVPDLVKYTDLELCSLKYDDLRKYLRSQSISVKGTKKELLDRVVSHHLEEI